MTKSATKKQLELLFSKLEILRNDREQIDQKIENIEKEIDRILAPIDTPLLAFDNEYKQGTAIPTGCAPGHPTSLGEVWIGTIMPSQYKK